MCVIVLLILRCERRGSARAATSPKVMHFDRVFPSYVVLCLPYGRCRRRAHFDHRAVVARSLTFLCFIFFKCTYRPFLSSYLPLRGYLSSTKLYHTSRRRRRLRHSRSAADNCFTVDFLFCFFVVDITWIAVAAAAVAVVADLRRRCCCRASSRRMTPSRV